ncbi:O-antigen ligase family protein [Nonlabens agnitus]|uniref:O-antigen ligase-related domain-containing protein n=1 Tax=Nonlabens agnitus TaxID=870484 RepID=A0A2S9WTX1_9FLAO|nr:O-antigen ligase family protein [Nonlabens agnitus]PRP66923.1 hypothetical protein BST86_07335 [Nonlabens agnitus]
MTKFCVFLLSLILALGNLTDLLVSYLLEVIMVLVSFIILFQKKYHPSILIHCKQALPLFLILFILFVASVSYGAIVNESVSLFNVNFFLVILIYIILSAFFNINKDAIPLSLIFFSVGTAILSFLYFFDILATGLEVRNDRLLFLGENPNSLSVRIALGVVIFIWVTWRNILEYNRFKRFCFLIPVPFMIALIIASGSKGSFLLCIISIVILLIVSKNISSKTKIITFLILPIVLIPFYKLFIESSLYDRFLNSSLTTGRSEIWEQALNIFYENPLGVGEGGYFREIREATGDSIDTHNLFIYLLATGGFISFILFVFFYYKLLVKAYLSFKNSSEPIFLIIWISMFFVMNKTGGVISYLVMWFFLAMINSRFMFIGEKKKI